MDEAVKRLHTLMSGAVLLGACCAAHAQPLRDPTRPPAELLAARPGAAAASAPSSAPQLQSVLIAPHAGGRHVAVIDGETVRLGDSFRGARVARMTQTQVELVRGRQRQVLRLSAAEATPAAPAASQRWRDDL
jgi:MSHA biogenesis protein MshK